MTDDQQQDQHDPQVSEAYRRLDRPQSPAHLDQIILRRARSAGGRSRRSRTGPFAGHWTLPISLAAMLVLTIAIVPVLQDEFQPVDPTMPLSDSTATDSITNSRQGKTAESQARKLAAPQAQPNERTRQLNAIPQVSAPEPLQKSGASMAEKKKESAPSTTARQQPLRESESIRQPETIGHADSAPATAAVQQQAAQRDPVTWLQEIRLLFENQQTEQARQELERFKKQYPDYDIDQVIDQQHQQSR